MQRRTYRCVSTQFVAVEPQFVDIHTEREHKIVFLYERIGVCLAVAVFKTEIQHGLCPWRRQTETEAYATFAHAVVADLYIIIAVESAHAVVNTLQPAATCC